MTQNHPNAIGLQRPTPAQLSMHRRINDRPALRAMGCRPWKDHEREAIRPPDRDVKRSKSNGRVLPPKPGIWPPPVYEAHYRHYGRFGRRTRTLRMSFWSAAGRPVEASTRREIMADPYHARGGQFVAGYVCQGESRRPDYPAARVEAIERPRMTVKQVREGLGRLLACLDGSITDHDEIRQAVIEARKLAA